MVQLKEYRSIMSSINPNFEDRFLVRYVFCKSCEHEIILPVLQIKSQKTISRFRLVKNASKNSLSNFGLIAKIMDL